MATQTRPATTPMIELEGVVIGPLRAVQLPALAVGTSPAAGTPEEPPRDAAFAMFGPLQAEFAISQSNALTDWMTALARRKPADPMSGAVVVVDPNGAVARQAEFTDGLLQTVELATLDVSAKDAMTARVSWQPTRMVYRKAGTTGGKLGLPGKSKVANVGAFRVSGLPFEGAARVTQVQLPKVSAELVDMGPGRPLRYGPIALSEVELSFVGAAARDAALEWAMKSLDVGATDTRFPLLDVDMLDAAFKATIVTFSLRNCAFRSYEESAIETGASAQPTATIRLAVEDMDIVFART